MHSPLPVPGGEGLWVSRVAFKTTWTRSKRELNFVFVPASNPPLLQEGDKPPCVIRPGADVPVSPLSSFVFSSKLEHAHKEAFSISFFFPGYAELLPSSMPALSQKSAMECMPPPPPVSAVSRMQSKQKAATQQLRTLLDLYDGATASAESVGDVYSVMASYSPDFRRAMANLVPPELTGRDSDQHHQATSSAVHTPTKRRREEDPRSPSDVNRSQKRRVNLVSGANRRAAEDIRAVQKKMQFVQRHGKDKKPGIQKRVEQCKKEIMRANKTMCYFYKGQGSCSMSDCPYKHSPQLTKNHSNLVGSIETWIKKTGQNSFGFIALADGNTLYCPQKAFGTDADMSTVRKGAKVRVHQIRDPDRPGGKFVACSASVARSAVEVD